MKRLGLDIAPHRRRMNESQLPLDEKFEDPEDPLRIVFLCAMWMTGFDATSCSTLYPDKPLRNHTLMQTVTCERGQFAAWRDCSAGQVCTADWPPTRRPQ